MNRYLSCCSEIALILNRSSVLMLCSFFLFISCTAEGELFWDTVYMSCYSWRWWTTNCSALSQRKVVCRRASRVLSLSHTNIRWSALIVCRSCLNSAADERSWFVCYIYCQLLCLLPHFVALCGAGAPLFPPCPFTSSSFPPFYFYLSFTGFTYFLLLSIPSLSTRIVPLRFQAGDHRRRPNLG